VAVCRNGERERQARSDRVIQQALGDSVAVHRRPDGKPEAGQSGVSTSHCGDLTLGVAGSGTVACDMEAVTARPPGLWRDLLGPEGMALADSCARRAVEDMGTTATRIWTAQECLKKAGAPVDAPLTLQDAHREDGWLVFSSGKKRLASVVVRESEQAEPLAITLLVEHRDRAYEYRHVVGFEETNLVGNVYYANHVRWQGRCREMFLRDHAPDVLAELAQGLALVTTRVSCEYLAELSAFDEVVIRMRLGELAQNRMTMLFEYWRYTGDGEELVARGEQQVACMRRDGERLVPTPVPGVLREALRPYAQAPL
jgi:enediyne biosynthesis thioesterase